MSETLSYKNGLSSFFVPAFLYVGALWILTFPAAMISAIQFFGSGAQMEVNEQKYKTQLSRDNISK